MSWLKRVDWFFVSRFVVRSAYWTVFVVAVFHTMLLSVARGDGDFYSLSFWHLWISVTVFSGVLMVFVWHTFFSSIDVILTLYFSRGDVGTDVQETAV